MKKTALLIATLALILTSCNNDKMGIEGTIDDTYNGKTVYLYTVESGDYNKFRALGTSVVEDGKFRFDGLINDKGMVKEDLPTIGYVSLFDMLMNEEDLTPENANSPIATVILEEGIATLAFSDNSVVVGGTARNIEFNKMHQAIKNLVDFTSQFTSIEELEAMPANAEGKDGRAQLQNLDQKLRDQSFAFIKNNMTNSVGEYLFLKSAGDMFTPAQVVELISMASDKFVDRPEILELDQLLSGMSMEGVAASGEK